jgi:hypothetical protein
VRGVELIGEPKWLKLVEAAGSDDAVGRDPEDRRRAVQTLYADRRSGFRQFGITY